MSTGRKKAMRGVTVFFDLDGVLFRGQSQHLLLDLARRSGLIAWRHYLPLLGWFLAYRLGLVRRTSRIRARAYRLFAGLKVVDLDNLLAANSRKFFAGLDPRALELLEDHRRQGHRLILISAAIEPLVAFIANRVGMDRFWATRLEERAGRFTGEILGQAMYGARKLEAARYDLHQTTAHSIVYADHISDLPLLAAADEPVCVNPDRRLAEQARCNGWKIVTTQVV